MNLGNDPYTSNRYAFGGGNPTSFIELDGHQLAPIGGGSSSKADSVTESAKTVDSTSSCGFWDVKCGLKQFVHSDCGFWDLKCGVQENAEAQVRFFLQPADDAWDCGVHHQDEACEWTALNMFTAGEASMASSGLRAQAAAMEGSAAGRSSWGPAAGKTLNGVEYYTPKTPGLQNAINPERGGRNCGLCAMAADAALAGGEAKAIPGAAAPKYREEIESAMGGKFRERQGITGVVGDLKRWGPGSRAIIGGWPGGGGVGHYFNAVNRDGKILFIDAQKGQAYHVGRWDEFWVMRTDNL
jgi:hypothetical protein